ncbi:MAG: D-lyxose/D-mannose family sugar isomerase [Anaerolineae bacterium]|nr:D-lyxose/D-mannose family sugar isomerase [Anaerolineae bacterium]
MKRSEINAIMRDVEAFVAARQFYLPPFAYWDADRWAAEGNAVRQIVERKLGWDVTDFGRGDFARLGLTLFTIRNGSLEDLAAGAGELYCEKALVVDVDQVTPLHYHWNKTEDIINRGGGVLAIEVYNATPEGELANTEVTVRIDGLARTVPAGGRLLLTPGESIRLVPYCYHTFWASEQRVLVGEVSVVNDDDADNRFYEPLGRFPEIEEDEPPLHLMVGDYEAYCRLDR